LSKLQMRALLVFLEAQREFVPEKCPLKRWLQVRVGHCSAEPDEADK